MPPTRILLTALLAALCASHPSTTAALPQTIEAEELNAYPYSASRAAVTRLAGGGDPDIVVFGLGSGIQVFSPGPQGYIEPYEWNGLQRRDVGGVVRDLVLHGDHLYVACQRGGLRRYDVSTWTEEILFTTTLPEQAWRIAVFDEDADTYVVLGTNTQRGGGAVRLFRMDDPVVQVDALNLQAEVWSVAVSQDVVDDTTTILAGTACGGVVRWDVDHPVTSLGTPFVLTGSDVFARGLAIHVVSPTDKRAYVAAHSGGVRALDLDTPGELAWITTGWPYYPAAKVAAPNGHAYVTALALDPAINRLAVALGPWFQGEEQYGAVSQAPLSCLSPRTLEPNPGVVGAHVINVANRTAPAFEAQYDDLMPGGKIHAPGGVAMRRSGGASDSYTLELPLNAKGAVSVRMDFDDVSGVWAGSEEARITDADGVLLHGCNIPTVVHDALYLSTELGLATFSLAGASESWLENPTSIILDFDEPLHGFITAAGAGPEAPRVYGSSERYIHIANVQGAKKLAPTIAHKVIYRNARDSFYFAVARGIPVVTPQWRRWIYFANSAYFVTSPPGSVHQQDDPNLNVWEVGNAVAAGPQVRQLGQWVGGGMFQGAPVPDVRFGSVGVLDVQPGSGPPLQAVYVAYGSKTVPPSGSSSPYAGTVGVFVFEARNVNYRRVALELVAIVPIAALSLPASNVGDRVVTCTIDESAERLYVCFGSSGVGVYDIADPFDPQPLGQLDPAAPNPSVIIQAIVAGSRLYLAGMERGIGVILDTSSDDIGAWDVHWVPTRGRCVGLALDPSDTSGETLFVGDSVAGVLRVQITEQP